MEQKSGIFQDYDPLMTVLKKLECTGRFEEILATPLNGRKADKYIYDVDDRKQKRFIMYIPKGDDVIYKEVASIGVRKAAKAPHSSMYIKTGPDEVIEIFMNGGIVLESKCNEKDGSLRYYVEQLLPFSKKESEGLMNPEPICFNGCVIHATCDSETINGIKETLSEEGVLQYIFHINEKQWEIIPVDEV